MGHLATRKRHPHVTRESLGNRVDRLFDQLAKVRLRHFFATFFATFLATGFTAFGLGLRLSGFVTNPVR